MTRDHKPSSSDIATPAPAAPSTPDVGIGSAAAATIYRSVAPGPAPSGGGSAVDSALASAGQGDSHPSGATLHTDATAGAAASELNAHAFTAGKDVYFAVGQYKPGTAQGDALLNHELAHVEQGRGVAPPRPGAYKVSSPHDAAEVAATAAESGDGHAGGTAEPGTIHTKPAAKPPAAPADPADKLQEFFDALAASNVGDAKTKWAKLSPASKALMRGKKVKAYPAGLKADPIESVIEIMGKDGLPIVRELKAAFDHVSYVDAILDGAGHDAAYWMPALKANTVYNAWFAKMPDHAALTEPRAAKLDSWMTHATAVPDARKIFEHAYPKLMDKTYYAPGLRTTSWAVGDIKRMWKALQGKLPLAHVQTITGGFNLGTQEKLFTRNAAGALIWAQLGFGWHDPGANVIVMPKVSSNKTGGGTGHDMTGGDVSGVAVAGTKADPKLSHWDGTMLHEIGHGVGSKTDGNKFAETHGDWKGGMAIDVWSKHLFDDAKVTKALPTPPPKTVLPAAEARTFLASEIAGTAYTPPKWTRKDVVAFINAHYAGEKLTQYWLKVKGNTPAYYVDANNHDGGRTYVWLERGGLNYSSYKKDISDNKVSWYSLSSTVEWFAEQYANFYRTGKTGTGADATTKKKLEDIDKMDSTATGGLSAPAPHPGGGAAGGEGAPAPGGAGAAQSADHGSKGGGAPQVAHDEEAAAVAARIRRMTFA